MRASALLALQRSAGNQAVTRALLQRAPKDPPEGVSLPADPLPAGANVADPDASRIVADPSLPGGWNDTSGKSASGHVGGVDRILLEGMPGNQQQQADHTEQDKQRRSDICSQRISQRQDRCVN